MNNKNDVSKRAKRICWIYPERASEKQRDSEDLHVWDVYKKIAEDCGLQMSIHSPESVIVDGSDNKNPCVYIGDEIVSPQDTIFVTSLWSLPHQTQDVCNELLLYTILEQLGFYLPIPPKLSFIATDKLATLIYLNECPVPHLPTIRIGSGRDASTKSYESAINKLEYPAIVKPAYWGMGLGVCLVNNMYELRGIVSLASGSDTALVCQPYLGEGVNDYRVYVVDGHPHTILKRIPKRSSLTANLSAGGSMEFVPLPSELSDAVTYVATKLPIPYLGIDFLYDGKNFWLSEIEPDAAVGFPDSEAAEQQQHILIKDRFNSYITAHSQWIKRFN
jgi:glutathione synthase/RimK-type ligase-like ATP-grasp enzyme